MGADKIDKPAADGDSPQHPAGPLRDEGTLSTDDAALLVVHDGALVDRQKVSDGVASSLDAIGDLAWRRDEETAAPALAGLGGGRAPSGQDGVVPPGASTAPLDADTGNEPPSAPRTLPRVNPTDFGEFRADWPGDSEAKVWIEPTSGGVVRVSDIYRGAQPAGTGGQMLADTLRDANVPKPTELYLPNVQNKPTTDALSNGRHVSETVLGRLIEVAAAELGGKVSGWETGVELDKPFIRATLKFEE